MGFSSWSVLCRVSWGKGVHVDHSGAWSLAMHSVQASCMRSGLQSCSPRTHRSQLWLRHYRLACRESQYDISTDHKMSTFTPSQCDLPIPATLSTSLAILWVVHRLCRDPRVSLRDQAVASCHVIGFVVRTRWSFLLLPWCGSRQRLG